MANHHGGWRPPMPAMARLGSADGENDDPDDPTWELTLGGVSVTQAEIQAALQIQVELTDALEQLGPIPAANDPGFEGHCLSTIDAIREATRRHVGVLGMERYQAILNASGLVSRTRAEIEMNLDFPPPASARH
jgi:hypothetical protein